MCITLFNIKQFAICNSGCIEAYFGRKGELYSWCSVISWRIKTWQNLFLKKKWLSPSCQEIAICYKPVTFITVVTKSRNWLLTLSYMNTLHTSTHHFSKICCIPPPAWRSSP